MWSATPAPAAGKTLMSHRHAPLTGTGRLRPARRVVAEGRPPASHVPTPRVSTAETACPGFGPSPPGTGRVQPPRAPPRRQRPVHDDQRSPTRLIRHGQPSNPRDQPLRPWITRAPTHRGSRPSGPVKRRGEAPVTGLATAAMAVDRCAATIQTGRRRHAHACPVRDDRHQPCCRAAVVPGVLLGERPGPPRNAPWKLSETRRVTRPEHG